MKFYILLLIMSGFHLSRLNATERNVVSYVDCSLEGSQKYVLRIDEKPFYMTNIQIRLDKLRYYWNWNTTVREAIVAQAAADGFNTVSIPLHWYEVEPDKDKFDWKILDEYLGLAKKYNLKVELLWFGQNSGGHVQWLGDPGKNPVHLRTPDYVLYSPAPNSKLTTSEYTIRRDMSDYTLDLNDNRLKKRETYVLSKVMEHIATWDFANGSKHTVIGVQLNNEVLGKNGTPFPASLRIAYMNDLASAVKNSDYVVWTRMNCVMWDLNPVIEANEAIRSSKGTNIDFAGIDLYGIKALNVRQWMPYAGNNYRMIMECGAEISDAALFPLAALSGNNAYDHYDMCSPDGHGLYDRTGEKGFMPHGSYAETIRTVNKVLNNINVDVATKANGYGLFVHNWKGDTIASTVGVDSIVFIPAVSSSQGISIRHRINEFVITSTGGGVFKLPSSFKVKSASKGCFDRDNRWIIQKQIVDNQSKITLSAGEIVQIVLSENIDREVSVIEQAEFAKYGDGVTVESTPRFIGFAGNGYVCFPEKGGSVYWEKVNGLTGGIRTIRIRYANGTDKVKKAILNINGSLHEIQFSPTNSWETFKFVSLTVPLTRGCTNKIRINSESEGCCNIDELQIL